MTPEIQFNSGAISAGECVTEAWEMLKAKYGIYLGISLIAMVMTACIPCLNIFLLGPIMGGIVFVVLRDLRGEPIEFGMMFKGFENFVPLMIIGLIQSVPGVISQGVQYTFRIGQLAGGFGGNGGRDISFYQSSAPDLAFSGAMAVVLMIVAIVAMVFAFVWWAVFFFAVPLVVDKGLDVGDAIKLSARAAMANVGGLLVLMIILGLVMLLGALLLCVGVFLISMPVMYIANVLAYRAVFPPTQDTRNYMPPDPGTYRDWGPGGAAA